MTRRTMYTVCELDVNSVPHATLRPDQNPHLSTAHPRPVSSKLNELIKSQSENERLAKEEFLNYLASIEDVKTGARSVSNARLGRTESPLGDATLLPVLTLQDLKFAHEMVVNSVGYTPTHFGFQLLQEVYRKGKWFGREPQFKLPKAYRAAGVDTIPMPDRSGGVHSDRDTRDASESIGSSIPRRDKRSRQGPGRARGY